MVGLLAVTLRLLHRGRSLIPLRGGPDGATGKRPALASWTAYQSQPPCEADLRHWFGQQAHSAYGIVCGQVSGLIVLDLDDPTIAAAFQARQALSTSHSRCMRMYTFCSTASTMSPS
jgi:hypothetical protein